jgi:hypothetical protein
MSMGMDSTTPAPNRLEEPRGMLGRLAYRLTLSSKED